MTVRKKEKEKGDGDLISLESRSSPNNPRRLNGRPILPAVTVWLLIMITEVTWKTGLET